jgi:RHS repeat-associated protein
MVEQTTGSINTQIMYGPSGAKLALMNSTALIKAFVPLTGGATGVYTSSGLAYYRHTDNLGSSRFASTPTQTLYSDTAYSPTGELYASSGAIDPSFTGQNQDTDPGLYDFLYREFDPLQAKWASPDPSGLAAVDPTNPQSWNRYV